MITWMYKGFNKLEHPFTPEMHEAIDRLTDPNTPKSMLEFTAPNINEYEIDIYESMLSAFDNQDMRNYVNGVILGQNDHLYLHIAGILTAVLKYHSLRDNIASVLIIVSKNLYLMAAPHVYHQWASFLNTAVLQSFKGLKKGRHVSVCKLIIETVYPELANGISYNPVGKDK